LSAASTVTIGSLAGSRMVQLKTTADGPVDQRTCLPLGVWRRVLPALRLGAIRGSIAEINNRQLWGDF
jgi:hypothetical protein